MNKIIVLALLFFSQHIVAQADALSGIYKEYEVDTKPSFPGGLKAFTNFVNKNFNWVNNSNAKSVTLEFTVQTNGIFVINHVSSVGSGNELEAVRVLKLSPKWKPATVKGKAVVCTIVRTMYNPNFNKQEKIVEKTIDNSMMPEPEIIAPVPAIQDENKVYKVAEIEQQPDYPGGLKQFYAFFAANFKMPEEEIKGKVIVEFIIEKDGSLTDIKVLRDAGFGTGEETIRVIKMAQKWRSGKQNGKVVRTSYTLPISIGNIIKS